MKRLLLTSLLLAGTSAQAAGLDSIGDIGTTHKKGETGFHGLLGVAGASVPEYSGSDKQDETAIPLIVLNYNNKWYWNINRGGVWLLDNADESLRLGLAAKIRRGYDDSDSDDLDGMDDRDPSLEAGAAFYWGLPVGSIDVMAAADVTSNSDGYSVSATYKLPLMEDAPMTNVTLMAGVEWLSEDVVDYYYGVEPSEVRPGRPAYEGDSTVNGIFGVVARHNFTKSWAVMGGAVYKMLGDEIDDSSIVEEDSETIGFVGVGWTW